MLELLAALKATHAVLLIEHDMDAVFRIADRITVMVNGAVIASDAPAPEFAGPRFDLGTDGSFTFGYVAAVFQDEVDVHGQARIPMANHRQSARHEVANTGIVEAAEAQAGRARTEGHRLLLPLRIELSEIIGIGIRALW